jgi:hypothetical protein
MSRFRLSVPVMNSNVTAASREQHLAELRRAGADRVFIALDRCLAEAGDPERAAAFSRLGENIAYFAEAGLEVGVWTPTLGFGGPLAKKDLARVGQYARITSVGGATALDAFCPMDGQFVALIGGVLRDIALAGARMIMLDDELCLSVRPGLGCACDLHMAEYRRRLGEDVHREELLAKVFSGGPGRHRDAWLDLMGDTLREFCRAMRAAVDGVHPAIRMGFCAGYTSWDVEGADALELTRILAGGTRPFLRFTGAPYWVALRRFAGQSLPTVIETVRMQSAWCAGQDVETFHEADSYPRPRYHVPAALVECYDLCLRASGGMDGLKYLLDYTAPPLSETGYTDRHVRNAPVRDWIDRAFGGKQAVGVRVHEAMRKLRVMELPGKYPGVPQAQARVMATFFSPAQCLLTAHAIPTAYAGRQAVGIAFGANAGFLDDEALSGGLILDATAARILSDRGVDVGLVHAAPAAQPDREVFPARGDRNALWNGGGDYFALRLRAGAVVQSCFRSDESEFPAAYTYENAAGGRFLVYAFDGYSVRQDSDAFRSYGRGRQLDDALAWLGRGPMPAVCSGHPGLYMICKQGDGAMAIALCNIFEDAVFAPEIRLGREHGKARFIGCEGRLEGGRLVLSTDIGPFGFAGIEVAYEQR